MARMSKHLKAAWITFAAAVPISLYVTFWGIVFMGFCPGKECWPHNFAWILISPCLLLAIWSLRAVAIASVLLLAAHVYADVVIFGSGLSPDALWGTDKGLDACLWIAVVLLITSAFLFRKDVAASKTSN